MPTPDQPGVHVAKPARDFPATGSYACCCGATGRAKGDDNVRDLHVDLPAGLGEEVTNPKIILGPAEDPAFRLEGRATISDPVGAPIGSVALRFERRRTGRGR